MLIAQVLILVMGAGAVYLLASTWHLIEAGGVILLLLAYCLWDLLVRPIK